MAYAENKDKLILLVEDNPDDREAALQALRRGGISNHIDVARDGQEALDYLFNEGNYSNSMSHSLPELILLDLRLPKLDGLQVLKKIRENPKTEQIPVIILTGSLYEKDLLVGYSHGANSYIVKPIDMNQLVQCTSRLGLSIKISRENKIELRT